MDELVTESAGLPVNAPCNLEMKNGSGLYVLRTSFFLLMLAAKDPDRFMSDGILQMGSARIVGTPCH